MDELSSLSHRSLRPTRSAVAEADLDPHARPPLLRLEPAAKARNLLQMFLNRRWLIMMMLVTLNLFAVVAIHLVKPRYTAEASLIIGPRQAQILDLKSVLAGLSGDSEVIESEVQLLRSRRVVSQVVRSLHLEDNPEFNPPSTGPGLLATLQTKAVGSAIRLWNRFGPAHRSIDTPTVEAASTPASKRDPVAIATDNALRRTSINPKGHSRVISVSFDSGDPALSARVANDIVTAYIADQLNAKRDATTNARKWLDDRVGEMREQVVNADRAVADYRQRAGIIRSRTGNLLNEQISTVGEQYIQSQTARAAAQSRVQASRFGGATDNLPDAPVSPLVQSLRGQQATLMAQIAEMTRVYGPDFPKLVGTRAALGAIEGRIGAELGKSSGSLQQDLRAAQTRETLLAASLAALRRDANTSGESEVELRALEHEADANRVLYDRLLARSRETNVEAGLQQPDAQLVSAAEAPESPSFPNPAIILPIFFIASLICTVLVVFAIEALDNGFASLEQVENTLGVRALGVVPRLPRGLLRRNRMKGQSPQVQAAFAEAVRNLHTGLMLSGRDRPPKIVLVTSAVPGEGKSSVVLSLARLMASCGKRVVVLDCDLRRPGLHKAFGGSIAPGLVEHLTGTLSANDVLQKDALSPAYLIAAGEPGRNAPDLFASAEMRALMTTLSERFDLILVDSSPILAVSETRHLCRLVDKTLMVVRWKSTRRHAVALALRQVLEAGGSLAGVLLSVVDLQQFSRHSGLGVYQRRIGLYLSE